MALRDVVTVALRADTTDYTRGVQGAARQTGGLASTLKRLGPVGLFATAGLTTMATRGFGAVIGAVGSNVKAFADFDAKMTESLAIMGNVTDDMRDRMEQVARDVARTTTFSAEEAAESYFFLASAGLDAAQAIEALPAVAEFAQAGMFDMALATDLLTDAQSALGLTSSDAAENLRNMTRVSDVFVRANTLANTSVQQVSEAITNKLGAALRAYGITIEEGTAVLAAFADQGIKGAAAGEAFSIVLRDLKRAATENAEAFEQAGIQVFDAQGNFRPMADVIADLTGAFGGLSVAEQTYLAQNLGFQDRSFKNVQVLLGQEDAVRRYHEALKQAGGTTEDVAQRQLQTFNAQMDLARSRLHDVAIEVGSNLAPVLLDMMPTVEDLIETFGVLAVDAAPSAAAGLSGVADAAMLLLDLRDGLALFGNSTQAVVASVRSFIDVNDSLADTMKVTREAFARENEQNEVAIMRYRIRRGEFKRSGDAALDYANAVWHIATRARITETTLDGMARVLRATKEEQAAAIRTMVEHAHATGQVSESTRTLENRLAQLEAELGMVTDGWMGARQQVAAAGDDADTAASGFEALGDSVDEAGESADDGADEFRTLADALAEATAEQKGLAEATAEFAQPMLRAVRAAERLQAAQERLAEVQADGEATAEEFRSAQVDVLEAMLDLSAAEEAFRATNIADQLGLVASTLGITADEARDLLDTFGLLDGMTAQMSVIVNQSVRGDVAGGSTGVTTATSGEAAVPSFRNVVARQHGGPLAAGQAAIVGEAGPELFVPRTAGEVIPAGRWGGGVTVTVNNPQTSDLAHDLQTGIAAAQVLTLIEGAR